jgi:TonB-linked SusC/RagA family outer membrane protein
MVNAFCREGRTHVPARAQLKKLLRIMRLTAFLILAAALHVGARGFTQTVSISVKNAPLDKVFEQVKKQTGYSFMWDEKTLKGTKPVSLEMKNATIQQVMDACVKDQPITYTFIDNLFLIKTKTTSPNSLRGNDGGVTTQPPPIDIHGKIVNEKGEPVAASIVVKGTNKGTSTNDNGEFELKGISDDATLVISGISIESFEVKVGGRSGLVLNAATKNSALDEIKIIGYGTTTQRTSTGNVAKVSSEDISKQPVSNPLQALQGRVAGLYIQQQNGLPGGNFTVQIRGLNSINASNIPLYVIDGVPFNAARMGTTGSLNQLGIYGVFNQSPLNNISPSDIASIEVLKDADATAIYGSLGANGVILITTKRGTMEKMKVEVNVYSGFGEVTRMIPMLNTPQYLEMRREAFKNDGVSPTITNAPDLLLWDTTRYTNWQNYLIGGKASVTDVNASISGGMKQIQFLLSSNYRHEGTVFPGNLGDNKATVHLNISNTSSNQKFSGNLSAIYGFDRNNETVRDITSYIDLPPNAPPIFDSVGKLNWAANTWNNPFGFLLQKYTAETENLLSNASLNFQILPALHFKTNLGYSHVQISQVGIYPKASSNPSTNPTSSSIFGNNSIKTWIVEPQLEYVKDFGKSKINFLLGSTFQNDIIIGSAIRANNYPSDALLKTMAGAQSLSLISTTNTDYRYNAVFGRLNYKLFGKYLVNLTARRDGSSRFGPGKQFANFGSIGAGWIFSLEEFIKNTFPFLSYGKIRGSYGCSGNDQIGDYQFLNTYSSTSYPYSTTPGLYPTRLYNPDFSWEVNRKFEGGLELGVLSNKLLITASYFKNRSSNQLVGTPLPAQTGFTSIQANLPALVENTGWEFEINSSNVKARHLEWTTSFNLTLQKNELVDFPGLAGSSYVYTYILGQPLSIQRTIGFGGVDPLTGVFVYADVDKNNQLSYPNDLSSSKNVSQSFFGGFNNSLTLSHWQVDVFFQFVKQQGRNYIYSVFYPPGFAYNYPDFVMNRWQKTGDVTDIQKFTQTAGSAVYKSWNLAHFYGSNSISDASFIRLKNVSLSYNFSKSLIEKIKVQNLRLFVRGENLFTITGYKGMDPESQNYYSLPPLKVLTGGFSITF